MIRASERYDLRVTNQFADKRRKRKAKAEQRIKPVRDRVRRLALLQAGIGNGWLR